MKSYNQRDIYIIGPTCIVEISYIDIVPEVLKSVSLLTLTLPGPSAGVSGSLTVTVA